MTLKAKLMQELIRNGYSYDGEKRVWNIVKRSFRFVNDDMAKAFLKIRDHPRYKATIRDIEMKLIEENISRFLSGLENQPLNIIDISSTEGEKAKRIFKAFPTTAHLRYCPVNVSEYLVNLATKNIQKEKFQNTHEYAPNVIEDFDNWQTLSAALRNNSYQKNVILLLGSFISGFDINESLFALSQSMLPGDILIIGNGIRKGERFANLETYQHPVFNQWLIPLMKALGFKEKEVSYHARFTNNRLEVYYEIKVNRTLAYQNKKIEFRKGDEIIVAFQYKLYQNELREFCDMYFDDVEIVTDADQEYALVKCKR